MVITTNSQTAGKGQRGNTWESEPGKNLTLSVVVRPGFLAIESQFDLTVITSLSVVKTLERLGLSDASIKWPNDIYYQGFKLAGILIENTVRSNRLEWAVIGIGLNVNQEQFQVSNATSLAVITEREFELKQVQRDLLEHLNHYYQKLKSGKSVEIRDEYTKYLLWRNQSRLFREKSAELTFRGMINGVTDSGKLIITKNQRQEYYDFKEIVFLG